jgi:hypothetical protein
MASLRTHHSNLSVLIFNMINLQIAHHELKLHLHMGQVQLHHRMLHVDEIKRLEHY